MLYFYTSVSKMHDIPLRSHASEPTVHSIISGPINEYGRYFIYDTLLLPRLLAIFNMASRTVLSRAKFLGCVAFNELNFLRSSPFFGSSCIKTASYVTFSKNWTRNNDPRTKTVKTSLVQNGVRSFSLQNWLGECVIVTQPFITTQL